MDIITSLTSQAVNKALDGLSTRQKAISSNLANAETPGYKRRSVHFEDALESALSQSRGTESTQASNNIPLAMSITNAKHFAINHQPETVDGVSAIMDEANGASMRNDDNGVDLEYEMAQLAKNTERYVALSNIESRRMRSLKGVIQNNQ